MEVVVIVVLTVQNAVSLLEWLGEMQHFIPGLILLFQLPLDNEGLYCKNKADGNGKDPGNHEEGSAQEFIRS